MRRRAEHNSKECLGLESTMDYKGYKAGPINFSPEEKTFSGTVADVRDVIHFEGSSKEELASAFRESIDVYLELRSGSSSVNCEDQDT